MSVVSIYLIPCGLSVVELACAIPNDNQIQMKIILPPRPPSISATSIVTRDAQTDTSLFVFCSLVIMAVENGHLPNMFVVIFVELTCPSKFCSWDSAEPH